jgi:predicted nuclease of restriction endonuclease-like (RecB) superfamily
VSGGAEYGKRLIAELSERLTADFGSGYSVQNLSYMKQFYGIYPHLIASDILHAAGGKSAVSARILDRDAILHAPHGQFQVVSAWEPGLLHVGLSWTHFRTLLRVESAENRAFDEIEAIKNNWSARELERQINSLLFERLGKSKAKAGLMRLAAKGQEIQSPADVFKDPVVIEFLGLPESPRLVESDLEQAFINNLHHFLLEMGKGFAFVSRQERIAARAWRVI